ncbi:MAG: hypothetical protein K8T10_16945 [Candidatus Eremiobacteraeota bacterium]|nr:hypothetical protein [Candidatus Eremiobacteraeota bacterium]
MKLRSNTQSAIPAPKSDLSKTGKKEPVYAIKDKVDDLRKKEKDLGEDINKLKEMGVKKWWKGKQAKPRKLLAGIIGSVGILGMSALIFASGGSAAGFLLSMAVVVGIPMTCLMLNSQSSDKHLESARQDAYDTEVEKAEQELRKDHEYLERWEENKDAADKIVEASITIKEGSSVSEIINEEKSVTIGGIKLKKRR